jgi:hypothetical protein
MKCEVCRQICKRVWLIPGGQFACINCVPLSAFQGYPVWLKQRPELLRAEQTRTKRSLQAQITFHHKGARA